MFQPNRPPVKWSSVLKRLARRKGGSNEVEAVMAKLRRFVTAAMAEMGFYSQFRLVFAQAGFYTQY
jgi:hypothetical protein